MLHLVQAMPFATSYHSSMEKSLKKKLRTKGGKLIMSKTSEIMMVPTVLYKKDREKARDTVTNRERQRQVPAKVGACF